MMRGKAFLKILFSLECLAPSASKVGFGRVCANLSSTLIIPSAHIIFNDQSIRSYFSLKFLFQNFSC